MSYVHDVLNIVLSGHAEDPHKPEEVDAALLHGGVLMRLFQLKSSISELKASTSDHLKEFAQARLVGRAIASRQRPDNLNFSAKADEQKLPSGVPYIHDLEVLAYSIMFEGAKQEVATILGYEVVEGARLVLTGDTPTVTFEHLNDSVSLTLLAEVLKKFSLEANLPLELRELN